MDAEQLRLLMQDPKFMILLGMSQANPKAGLANMLGSGVQQAFTGQRLNDEEARRKQLYDRRAADDQREQATRASLSNAFRVMNERNMKMPGWVPPTTTVDTGLPSGPMAMPTSYESDQMRSGRAMQGVADSDPAAAITMLQKSLAGELQMPGIQPAERYGVKPWHAEGATPEELEQSKAIARGLAPSATSEEGFRLREQGLGLQEQGLRLREAAADYRRARDSRRDADEGGGDDGGEVGLSKEQRRRRAEINRAREAVRNLFKTGTDANAFAENNPGFKNTLELANQRMPGGDSAWESTMGARAKTEKLRVKATYEKRLKDAKMTGDKATAARIREEAAKRGIILPL